MASAIILNKRAGYIVATICSILYGLMIDLQFFKVIPITYELTLTEKDFLYNIFTHLSALYLTAFLTGHLSSRLENTAQRLEEKDSDLKDLTLFNQSLIESLPSGLLTTDRTKKILIFNRAAEQITGINRTSAMGRQMTDIFPFLTFPLMTGRRDGVIRHNAATKTIGLTISATADSEGNTTGYICVFQDITQLKNLEAELKHKETLAAIGELSANMAHEIRNPLASLKGSVEMLKEGILTEDQRVKLMNIAISEMDRLNKIIADFLSYSRPQRPEFSWFDLHYLLDETIELMKNAAVRTDRVTIQKDFSDENRICADPHKLRQVFLNLGINAIESMPEGGRLTIATKRIDHEVTISFQDSGVGIPPENVREIFYPFFTTKDTGTGLGLSIAYRIVEEHQGTITLASTPGQGTTFRVVLPVRATNAPLLNEEPNRGREPASHGRA
jgi:two-component system sensor histidine kinase PilS (NtrC family)